MNRLIQHHLDVQLMAHSADSCVDVLGVTQLQKSSPLPVTKQIP